MAVGLLLRLEDFLARIVILNGDDIKIDRLFCHFARRQAGGGLEQHIISGFAAQFFVGVVHIRHIKIAQRKWRVATSDDGKCVENITHGVGDGNPIAEGLHLDHDFVAHLQFFVE